jgi:hypothetical protein
MVVLIRPKINILPTQAFEYSGAVIEYYTTKQLFH